MVFGSDKNQTLVFTSLGKCFVLTEETVTRVNGLGASGFGRRDDFFSHQIRLTRSRWPNQDRLIGQLHMAGQFVSFRINGHGLYAHFLGGGDHSAGNFATVGDQNFVEHVRYPGLTKGCCHACAMGFQCFFLSASPMICKCACVFRGVESHRQ